MVTRDSQGRISAIDADDSINNGHSVCNECGKDMPVCWDVVCHECNKTFCYGCAVAIDDKWLCLKHASERDGG